MLIAGGGDAVGTDVAAEAFQIRTHFAGGLVAQVAILFECLINDVFEFHRQVGIQAHRSDRSAIQNRVGDDAGSFAAEGN